MTVHTLTATATDTMSATATDTVTMNSTTAAPPRVVKRSFMENRIQWGSVIDVSPMGPTFSNTDPLGISFYTYPDPLTLGLEFTVERPVTFTGCRIYKAPAASGTNIPVKLWSGDGTTGTELGAATIPSWTADGGGWRQVTFTTPVDLVPGTTYIIGYLAPDGFFAYTLWVWHAQDTVVWPLHNTMFAEAGSARSHGTAIGINAGSVISYPTAHLAHNFYIDPQVEWTDPMPGYTGGTAYYNQWTGPHAHSRHAFPLAVFFADPPYLSDYYAMGVNTLMGGSLSAEYLDAMAAMGNTMDWWPSVDASSPGTAVQVMTENPAVAASVVGYQLDDEPDQSSPYRSPSLLLGWRNALRQLDSTRPFYLGFTAPVLRNQSFQWSPQGATSLQVNEIWRQWIALADVVGADDYVWFYDNNASGLMGPWTYATQARRLREVTDDTMPVFTVIETTSQVGNSVPTPENIRKSVWAAIIGGARGIILFDHRFGSDFVTQDFAHMLHNPPMKAMMTTLATRLQSMGPALLAQDLGLVTAWTSSNTASGPMGGTFGVPLHYTTRSDGSFEYALVQAIRPGTTTGTVTIPTWANKTVTVIDESRTLTVPSTGVISDSFTDYQIHIYRRTLP